MDKMDYRDLLVRYMAHVGEMEGVDFTRQLNNKLFTDEEIEELKQISKDSDKPFA